MPDPGLWLRPPSFDGLTPLNLRTFIYSACAYLNSLFVADCGPMGWHRFPSTPSWLYKMSVYGPLKYCFSISFAVWVTGWNFPLLLLRTTTSFYFLFLYKPLLLWIFLFVSLSGSPSFSSPSSQPSSLCRCYCVCPSLVIRSCFTGSNEHSLKVILKGSCSFTFDCICPLLSVYG